MGPSWLAMIRTPEAVMNPEITGWLMKFTSAPNRNSPIATSMAPEMSASSSAAASISGVESAVPSAPLMPAMADAVINEMIATGPTASVLLVPNSAYSTNGNMLAYRPTCAGGPASSA